MPEENSLRNLKYLHVEKSSRRLTSKDLAELTGYTVSSVKAWFANPESPRRRYVPDRAVAMMRSALKDSDIEKFTRT